MRRLVSITVALLLVTTFCFAQPARNPSGVTVSREPTTSRFTNIQAMGLDVTANPGYIALVSSRQYQDTSGNQYPATYYLWVDRDGELMIASGLSLINYSSFPTGNWYSLTDEQTGITKVGGQ